MSFLFGGGKTPQVTPTLPSFNAGGLSGSVGSNGSASVTAGPERTALVGGLSNTYATLGNEYGNLRGTVAPGFNDLLNARLTDINNQAHQAVGDLRQNLSSRRILGSSFGNDTIARTQLAASQLRDKTIADNFLQSLDANQKLLTQQYTAYANQFNSGLTELNLEADVASKLAGQGADILNKTAQMNADLEAKSQAGAGQFLGTLIGTGAKLAPMFMGGAGGAAAGGAIDAAAMSGFGSAASAAAALGPLAMV